jgi:hypothetical protein
VLVPFICDKVVGDSFLFDIIPPMIPQMTPMTAKSTVIVKTSQKVVLGMPQILPDGVSIK